MRNAGVEIALQIEEQRACRCNAIYHPLYAKTLQGLHIQLLEQLLPAGYGVECPFVHLGDIPMLSKMLFKPLYILPLQKNLLWRHIVQQHLQIVLITLRYAERPCGDIQKGHSAPLRTVKIESCKIVVLLLFKQLVAICYARRNQLCNTPLYQFFCHFRVFQLVADRNFITCPYQFGEIRLYRVVRKACHLYAVGRGVRSLCKHKAKDFAGNYRILSISFIEISHPKEEHCLRVLSLKEIKLLHHWGLCPFFTTLHSGKIKNFS